MLDGEKIVPSLSIEELTHRVAGLAARIHRLAQDFSVELSDTKALQRLSTELRVRPKPLTDLPPDLAKLIEDVQVDNRGRLIPRLYSKERANKELRNLLNLSAKSEVPDVTQLSDAELIAQLGQLARELNINIDVQNYTFNQTDSPAKTIDHEENK
jgi:hypothetical protein